VWLFVYGIAEFVDFQLLFLWCLFGSLCQCCYFGGEYTICALQVVHFEFCWVLVV
jgi:hypothetical protein